MNKDRWRVHLGVVLLGGGAERARTGRQEPVEKLPRPLRMGGVTLAVEYASAVDEDTMDANRIAYRARTTARQIVDPARWRDADRRRIEQQQVGPSADRDPAAAEAALIAAGENTPLNDHAVHFNRSFVEGWIARLEKDEPKARIAFESARSEQEKIVEEQPDYAPSLCVLGVIDAALGRKQEALSECRRAVELLPVTKDAFNGQLMIQWYATAAAWVGEKDLALEELAMAANAPGILSYGHLKLLPFWDPLRGDPRFEKIVGSLAPKE